MNIEIQLEAVLHLSALVRMYKDSDARIAAAGPHRAEVRAFYDKIGAAIHALHGIDGFALDDDVVFRFTDPVVSDDDTDVVIRPQIVQEQPLQYESDDDDDDVVINRSQ